MVVKRKGLIKRTNIRDKLETNSNTNHSNYWTSLTSQVEEQANITQHTTIIDKEKLKRVRFKLPLNGKDSKNSKKWRRQVQEKAQQRESGESVPCAVYYSGTTLSRRMNNNAFIITE